MKYAPIYFVLGAGVLIGGFYLLHKQVTPVPALTKPGTFGAVGPPAPAPAPGSSGGNFGVPTTSGAAGVLGDISAATTDAGAISTLFSNIFGGSSATDDDSDFS